MNYFIPPSLYFKLLTAHRKGEVKIPDDYKHLDWIKEDKLLEAEATGAGVIDKNSRTPRLKLFYNNKFELTTKGKTLFFRITWGLFIAAFGLIGAVISWAISYFT